MLCVLSGCSALCIKLARVTGPAIPSFPMDSIPHYPKLLGAVQKPRIVPICRCLEKPNKEQTGEFRALPALAQQAGVPARSLRCSLPSPFPFPSGIRELERSVSGLSSVPAGRMGGPGQGSEGFHSSPPTLKKINTLSALKVSFYSGKRVCCRWFYPHTLPACPGGDFTQELYPLLKDLAYRS